MEDPGSSFTRIRFIPRMEGLEIESYQPDGSVAEILTGKLKCILQGTRTVDTIYGPGMVADVAITEDGPIAPA